MKKKTKPPKPSPPTYFTWEQADGTFRRYQLNITSLSPYGYGHRPLRDRSLTVWWRAPGFGFGNIHFTIESSGQLLVDTECMPDKFVEAVVRALSKKLLTAERIG